MNKKRNTARWTRDSRGGWQLIVDFVRHWEAPKIGTGKGRVVEVDVYKRGARTPITEKVELTSRVFGHQRTGRPAAFAERL